MWKKQVKFREESQIPSQKTETQSPTNASMHSSKLVHILPYGGVMATGGASAIAHLLGIHFLVLPLLLLAILEGFWVPISRLVKHRNGLLERIKYWCTMDPLAQQVGKHTVPLGLAVVLSGLIHQAHFFPGLKIYCIILFYITLFIEVWMLVRAFWGVICFRPKLWEIDGATFILPAALLGFSMATLSLADLWRAESFWLLGLAKTMLVGGWVLFWILSILAVQRLFKYRLKRSIAMFWWIWMGCAGLAGGAIAQFMNGSMDQVLSWSHFLEFALIANTAIALLLCLPIFLGSLNFLFFHCQFRDKATWQPTFSTAVYTMGIYEAGKIFDFPTLILLGTIAGFATLVFWSSTIIWNLFRKMIIKSVQ